VFLRALCGSGLSEFPTLIVEGVSPRIREDGIRVMERFPIFGTSAKVRKWPKHRSGGLGRRASRLPSGVVRAEALDYFRAETRRGKAGYTIEDTEGHRGSKGG
jgi:hypothetical protein